MKILWGAPLLLLLSSTGSLAAEAPAAKQASEAPKMVCVEAPRTGSNIKRRSCMSEAQAEQRRKEDQLAAEGLKRGSAGRSKADTDRGVYR